MVQTVFYLRFTAQLRRTRPELVTYIESVIMRAIQNAGGEIARKRQCISASYNERNLGFWLDILLLIETLNGVLERESDDLYGYAFLINAGPCERPETLCRSLAIGPHDGGIFLDRAAADSLAPYVLCEQVVKWPSVHNTQLRNTQRRNSGEENILRIKELKNEPSAEARNFPFRETILAALAQGQGRNTLIIGPAFSGKREGVYHYCGTSPDDCQPLSIRFGSGGLNALTDAWSDQIQQLVSSPEAKRAAAEIDSVWKFLFQQRLREEISPFMIQSGRRFFSLLLDLYTGLARQSGCLPTIVTENIHLAEKPAARIFIDTLNETLNEISNGTLNATAKRQEILILGTCDSEIADTELKNWEKIFQRVIKLSGENRAAPSMNIPLELREIACSLALFNRCFPAYMYTRLLREEGKNPDMIKRALSMLYEQGIIDSVQEPRLRVTEFSSGDGSVPDEKKELIRAMLRGRLLSRVKQGNLNPCFNLLLILSDLDGGKSKDDELILKSIHSDMVNGTVSEIEKAIDSGLLETIAGPGRAKAVIYIYKTTRALLSGTEDEIKSAFVNTAPDCASFPVFKAQTLANLSAYHLSMRNARPALDAVKETLLLSQGKNNFCLAESYRLFSLVSLAKQQINESNDYLNFAVENAEKLGNAYELGISAYYAAAAQFLYGNVSKALRLAAKAREQSLAAGLPEWADRARFLEGRLNFEIGSYRVSREIFESTRKNPAGASSPEKDSLLAAWAYRAGVFSQDPLVAKPENSGYDTDLFEIEAAYLARDFRKTVELANALTLPSADENFIFTEQPDWRSGFAQCELLYFRRHEIWKHMIRAYHSMALCHLSPETGEEAADNIGRLLREEQISEIDPWDAFYFFAWFSVLKHSGAGQNDRDKAISMAFKRLQRRASRIDDIETRRQFVTLPRWNGELSLAAKEFKLI